MRAPPPSLFSFALFSSTLSLSVLFVVCQQNQSILQHSCQIQNALSFIPLTVCQARLWHATPPTPLRPHNAHAAWPWDQSNAGTLERLLKNCRTCTIMFIKCHLLIRYIMSRRDLGCFTAASCACWGRRRRRGGGGGGCCCGCEWEVLFYWHTFWEVGALISPWFGAETAGQQRR